MKQRHLGETPRRYARWSSLGLPIAIVTSVGIATAEEDSTDNEPSKQKPGASDLPQDAEAGEKEGNPRLELRAGAGLLHSRAADEHSDSRPITSVFVGYDVIPKLQVAAAYDGQIGTWTHRFSDPSGGAAVDAIRTEEWVHQIGLRVGYDVVSAPRFTLTPHLGLEWLLLNSQATDLGTIGIGGGLTLGYRVDESVTLAGGGYGMFATASKDTQQTSIGPIVSYFGWRLGPTIHLSDISELHINYVGSILERDFSTRTSHGALLQMGFLLF